MKLFLVTFLSSQNEWYKEVKTHYKMKINKFCPFEIIEIKSPDISRKEKSKKVIAESQLIQKYIQPTDLIVLFDEKGKGIDSISFAKLIEKIQITGKKRCLLIVGGAYGIHPEIKEKAHYKISLSNLTLNHLVASTVVMEQIYRSYMIINNNPYHNE